MNEKNFKHPEVSTYLPLIGLVPSVGMVGVLESYVPSLLARYESVVQMRSLMVDGNNAKLGKSRYIAEEAMLKIVLDWLMVNTSNIEDDHE